MLSLKLYADGSSTGRVGEGGWAFVLLEEGTPKIIERSGGADDTTNNRMELMGVIEGLREIHSLYGSSPSNIVVYSDSQYVVKGITEWFSKWEVEIARGKEIKNQDLWLDLKDLTDLFPTINFEWVEGHAGIEYNERCDVLAKQAKQQIKELRDAAG